MEQRGPAGGSRSGRHIRRHRGLSHALLFKRGVHYLCRRKRRDIKQRPSTIITVVYKSAQPLITSYSRASASCRAPAFVRCIFQDSDRWALAKPCQMYFRREGKKNRKQPQNVKGKEVLQGRTARGRVLSAHGKGSNQVSETACLFVRRNLTESFHPRRSARPRVSKTIPLI